MGELPIPESIISCSILGANESAGCSRTVQGHNSLQFSTLTEGSAGWILCAPQAGSGAGPVPPRLLWVQNEYVALPDFSEWNGDFRGHVNVELQALHTDIRLQDEQKESKRRHIVVWWTLESHRSTDRCAHPKRGVI